MISDIINELVSVRKMPKGKQLDLNFNERQLGRLSTIMKKLPIKDIIVIKDFDNLKISLDRTIAIHPFARLEKEEDKDSVKIYTNPHATFGYDITDIGSVVAVAITNYFNKKFWRNLTFTNGIVRFKDKEVETDFLINVYPYIGTNISVGLSTAKDYYKRIEELDNVSNKDINVFAGLFLLGEFRSSGSIITDYKFHKNIPFTYLIISKIEDMDWNFGYTDVYKNRETTLLDKNWKLKPIVEIVKKNDGFDVSYYDENANYVTKEYQILDSNIVFNILKKSNVFPKEDIKDLDCTRTIERRFL